jgi:hypothetical protein
MNRGDRREPSFSGIGLHSGNRVNMTILPASANAMNLNAPQNPSCHCRVDLAVWFGKMARPKIHHAMPRPVTHSGNSVKVSWPSPSTGFVLQQNGNLATGSWLPANGFTVSDDGMNSITITSPTGNLFFRLSK